MKNTGMISDYIPRFFPNSLPRTLPILNSSMKDRCGFLFVRYKRHCWTDFVSWEQVACLLSGIKKRPLVEGWLNTSSLVISIGATANVRYREVVRSWEGPLWEVPLYSHMCITRTECVSILKIHLIMPLPKCTQNLMSASITVTMSFMTPDYPLEFVP